MYASHFKHVNSDVKRAVGGDGVTSRNARSAPWSRRRPLIMQSTSSVFSARSNGSTCAGDTHVVILSKLLAPLGALCSSYTPMQTHVSIPK